MFSDNLFSYYQRSTIVIASSTHNKLERKIFITAQNLTEATEFKMCVKVMAKL